MTTKERVLDLVAKMPDDTIINDIGYKLYAIQAIQAGLDELDRGEHLSHQEVGERLGSWLRSE